MRCAVLGSPIEHSLSPALHRAAYRELGIDWVYEAVEVRADELAGFVSRLDPTWRGLSLTMPLKRTVIGLLDQVDALVEQTGVANTVVLDEGRRSGFNTDIPGSANAIRERTSALLRSAIVLGGGATAASLGWALADLGCTTLRFFVRNQSSSSVAQTMAVIQQHPQAPQVEVRTLSELVELGELGDARADVVASTIPVAAQDQALLRRLQQCEAPVVFDVIYDPWPTPLATWAHDSGRTVVNGLDLLAHQAALQVGLMVGQSPTPATMRAAGLTALTALRGRPQP